ncbi:MAG: 4Fe-4S cluster-binding domain-containing protein [Methanospirillum sp.]|uniref:radical SAM protein n=1 Tax=Methanospirillum sp. TaxID=45200 RepID=UPI002370079F|nr:4Fe-4S cluster-binding domain-containing protein [Methanospirillum sp.]MDD1728547.1 4Fe-4S cluster-binding domain-containing protein [Methanospirillum sp.]
MDDSSSEDIPPHSRLSAGCKLCFEGAKLVLFVTGLCERSCWYCPLSAQRKNKDVTFANEHVVSSPEEMLAIAHKMSALGTGITGGEPFKATNRLVTYAKALKDEFGPGHQIHLYSGVAPTRAELMQIQGLVDEVRLHPPHEVWGSIAGSSFHDSIRTARELGFDIGIEVPSLPGIEAFLAIIDDLDFLNINELEWGESNAAAMRERGHELRGDVSNAVQGGKEAVSSILSHPKVHWCSSDFKDRVQLRMRLKRIAANTAREFDEITPDGTVVYGVWECDDPRSFVPDDLDGDLYTRYDDRIEMAWWILDSIGDDMPGKKYVIERYPDNGLVVEVTPL